MLGELVQGIQSVTQSRTMVENLVHIKLLHDIVD